MPASLEVFLKDADPDSSYIIPSQMALAENWSPVMASGDLLGSKNWLLQDLQSSATQGRYYVMQANPNNAESKMYEAMNSNTAQKSNLEFLRSFLLDLPDFILQAVAENPKIQINVIDSDFLNISKPYETAMKLMGLPGQSTMLEESSGVTILPILLYIAAFCILFGLLHCMGVFSGASGGPCRPSSWSHIWVVKQTHFERLSWPGECIASIALKRLCVWTETERLHVAETDDKQIHPSETFEFHCPVSFFLRKSMLDVATWLRLIQGHRIRSGVPGACQGFQIKSTTSLKTEGSHGTDNLSTVALVASCKVDMDDADVIFQHDNWEHYFVWPGHTHTAWICLQRSLTLQKARA